MTKLVESIAKSLVEHPEAVSVTEADDGRNSVLQLKVATDDMGKIIGKQGRIAKGSSGQLLRLAATKQNKKVVVEIVSENE